MATLLTGILAVVATVVGYSNSITIDSAERQAGEVTLVTAIVLLVVLLRGLLLRGYVAGRMSRFDGARQGFVVWLIATLVTIAAVVLASSQVSSTTCSTGSTPPHPVPRRPGHDRRDRHGRGRLVTTLLARCWAARSVAATTPG